MRIQIQYDAQLIEINRFTFNILSEFYVKSKILTVVFVLFKERLVHFSLLYKVNPWNNTNCTYIIYNR